MGWIIPPPYEPPPSLPGDPCSICWGIGKAFGDDDTPEEIVLQFSGINKSLSWVDGDGDPPEGNYVFVQTSIVPCIFDYFKDGASGEVRFFQGETFVGFINAKSKLAFVNASAPECALLFDNKATGSFAGGSCKITIPSVQA